ncbi:MAG TPA: large conductance mechanosensitive channel protein MscL [Bacteroidia bacterium]|nr:large conductance mechanosensitive channel protein MscL [Bacteroidia bacterium]
MGLIKEFKEFAVKGNVMDLAVGVIIGAAFTAIVKSLIDDVITPLVLNPLLEAGHMKHLNELVVLGTVKYGNFLAAIINFLVVALVMFLVIKGLNKMKAKEKVPEPDPEPTKEEVLLTEIRDLLKEKTK